MIVGDLKPLAEIVSAIKEYKQVLVLGCGSCVTVCLSGGEKEAEQLSRELSQLRHYQGTPPQFEVGCILRQCEQDLVLEYQNIPTGTDAILSLACGAGVQTLADAYDPLPVIPGDLGGSVPGMRRLCADLHRRYLPGGPLCQGPIQRSLRRISKRQLRSRPGYTLRLGHDCLAA
jgi:hypothetical protein